MLVRDEHGPVGVRHSGHVARVVEAREGHVAVAVAGHAFQARRWAPLERLSVAVRLGNLDVAGERDDESRLIDCAHEVIVRVGDVHSAVGRDIDALRRVKACDARPPVRQPRLRRRARLRRGVRDGAVSAPTREAAHARRFAVGPVPQHDPAHAMVIRVGDKEVQPLAVVHRDAARRREERLVAVAVAVPRLSGNARDREHAPVRFDAADHVVARVGDVHVAVAVDRDVLRAREERAALATVRVPRPPAAREREDAPLRVVQHRLVAKAVLE